MFLSCDFHHFSVSVRSALSRTFGIGGALCYDKLPSQSPSAVDSESPSGEGVAFGVLVCDGATGFVLLLVSTFCLKEPKPISTFGVTFEYDPDTSRDWFILPDWRVFARC